MQNADAGMAKRNVRQAIESGQPELTCRSPPRENRQTTAREQVKENGAILDAPEEAYSDPTFELIAAWASNGCERASAQMTDELETPDFR